MAKETVKKVPYMSMGSDLFNLLVGGDKGVMGLPYGAILNLAGDKSSGKSFLKNEIIAANYHANGGDPDKFAWFSDDCESGDTFNTEALYGVNIRPIDGEGYLRLGNKKVQDSATVEDMDAHVSLFLEHLDKLGNDAVGIYAVDSLDGLSDAVKEAMEGARLGQLKTGNEVKDKGDYGMQIPKFLSQNFFRPKHKKLEDAHCSLIIVSQIRDKIDSMGYGQKWDVSCGKALEFYCHTRIFLQTIAKLGVDGRPIQKADDLVTGAYGKATTFKSKTPRPYRTIYYSVYFNYGIDNIGSNLDYLFDLRGKDGKFVEGSDSIKWVEGHDLNKDTLAKWLTDVGVMDEVKAANKAKGGNYQVSMKFQQEWLAERFKTDPALQEKYIEYFGRQYTRDELIRMCEADPKMNAELTRRVIAKWEAREDSIPVRPSKYGTGRFATPAPQPAEPNPLAERPLGGGEAWAAPNEEEEVPEDAAEGKVNAETVDAFGA